MISYWVILYLSWWGPRWEDSKEIILRGRTVTDPPVGPQQEFLCLMSFKPIEWDRLQFRKKGKLWSLIKERKTTSGSGVHVLPKTPWQAALNGSPAGKGWSSRETRGAVLPMFWISARAHRLCTGPDAASTILSGGVVRLFLFPAAGLKQSVFTRNSHLDFPLGGLCM